MKKILSATMVALLASSLGFAQTTEGTKPQQKKPPQQVKHDPKAPSNEKIAVKGSKVKLNPQPEPPGVQKSVKNSSPGEKVAINPQPLPPGGKNTSPASKVALNPQPLPPGAKNPSPGSKVELNPQPLPPKETASGKKASPSANAKSKKSSGGGTTTQSPK